VDVCLGALLLIVGAGGLFVFFIRLRERDYSFLAFGMFALFAGLTYLSDVNALFFLNLAPATHHYLNSFSFLMVPTGLFAFFGTMFSFSRKYSWFAKNLWLFHCVVAAAGMVMSHLGIDYMNMYLLLLILNCTLCILVIAKSRDAAAMNIRISFVAFFLLFISLTLLHLMALLNLIPYTYDIFGWGLIGFVFALGYVLVRHYTSTYHAMQTVSLELEKNKSEMLALQKENLTSQLEALKNQVDPHFLFNSFSTLASIIEEGREMAVNFVQELSSVYRYVLQTRVETLVTVGEELEFIHSYSFLMSSRFGENLSIAVKVPEKFHRSRIIPFSLQLLVENAIKHNIISGKKVLTINLFEENGALVVENNLQKKTNPGSSTRIGLENIRNRYRLITGKEVRVRKTDTEFRVEIPLIDVDN
jgi:sensor histidine kinase YesM